MESLPVLDVTKLTKKQLTEAGKLFDGIRDADLLPLHEIDKDPVRRELDEEFCTGILDLPTSIIGPEGPLDLLRNKVAQEPSIRGAK